MASHYSPPGRKTMKIINKNDLYVNLDKVIRVGKKNAKTQRQICEETGLKPEQVKKAIQTYRRNHTDVFIVSDASGYYKAENIDDVLRFQKMMNHQISSRNRTLKNINRFLKEHNETIEGQRNIDDILERDNG